MEDEEESLLRRLRVVIILFALFWMIAILFWQLKGKIFFLFNFGYIGTAIAVGGGAYELLPRKKKPAGRRLAQLLVGIHNPVLIFLGLTLMGIALYPLLKFDLVAPGAVALCFLLSNFIRKLPFARRIL